LENDKRLQKLSLLIQLIKHSAKVFDFFGVNDDRVTHNYATANGCGDSREELDKQNHS